MNGEQIGKLVYDIDADDSKLSSTLDGSDKKVKDFGDGMSSTSEKLSSGLNKVAAGFAVAGAGLTLISKNATDFAIEAVKNAKALGREIGVSTTEASRLTAAFGRMGIASDSAQQMFGIFAKQIVASTESSESNRLAFDKLKLQIEDTQRQILATTNEIKKHGDKTGELNIKLKALNNTLASQKEAMNQSGDAFAKLGINTRDATGKQKDFNTLLFEVADKFKNMPNGIDKTALSMQLFGRSGKDMVKVLNLGSDGIKDLEDKADKLGLTLSVDTIGKINNLIISQKNLKEQTDALKISVGTATAPVLTAFNTELNSVLQTLIGTDGPVKTITVSFLAFAGPVFVGAAAVLSFTANLVQSWGAITAVVSSLGTFVVAAAPFLAVAVLITAGLVAIYEAARSVTEAFNAMNQAAIAQQDLENSNLAVRQRLEALSKSGTPEQKARANKALSAGIGLNAEGTDYWKGGLTWVHEKGPEIIDLPSGTRIIPHELSKQMSQNSAQPVNIHVNIGTINDKADADYLISQINRNFERIKMGVSGA